MPHDLVVQIEGLSDVTVRRCTCGGCQRDFYVPKLESPQCWHPNHCPFCGFAFEFLDIDGNPATYSPVPKSP